MKNDIFNYTPLIHPCPSISPRFQRNLSKQDPSIALIASLILVGIFTLAEGLSEIGVEVYPSVFLRGTMACTGVELCKLAITNTKDRATALVDAGLTRAQVTGRAKTRTNEVCIHE